MKPSSETILFLARSLGRGGAERQLVVLASGLARKGRSVAVAEFFGNGVYEAELTKAGVRVIELGKQDRWDVLPFLFRLFRVLRQERPLVLHGYLPVPNLLCTLFKPLLPGARIVWGVRASNVDLSRYDWLTRLIGRLECKLSRYADCIIANSHAGQRHAVANGFPEGKTVVIPNGIDSVRFRFDAEGRRRVRAEWGIGDDEVLIGLPARIDPMKAHTVFLQAANRITHERANARFVCVGDGAQAYAASIKAQSALLGLGDRLIWAGARNDMPAVYSAFDVACSSSSFGEGFSNAIAEAMACGVPCLVTDVGDSALIVADACRVVAPDDPEAMAAALRDLIDLPVEARRRLGRAGRARIESEFGLERLVQCTEQALGLV